MSAGTAFSTCVAVLQTFETLEFHAGKMLSILKSFFNVLPTIIGLIPCLLRRAQGRPASRVG